MNIAHELKTFQPQVVIKPAKVNDATLKAVFNAISNGFNMTNANISKVTGLSIGCASKYIKQLYNLGHLSRIDIMDGQKGYCWAYTAIKPLRGNL